MFGRNRRLQGCYPKQQSQGCLTGSTTGSPGGREGSVSDSGMKSGFLVDDNNGQVQLRTDASVKG
jgi:hypothetical protein